jgi:hypothetical protein
MNIFPINKDNYILQGSEFSFPVKAKYGALYNSKLIISLDWVELQKKCPDIDSRCAVWCYNLSGELLWRVGLAYYIDSVTKEHIELPDHVDSFNYWEKENILVAFGRMGYQLDPETGKLGEIVYKER